MSKKNENNQILDSRQVLEVTLREVDNDVGFEELRTHKSNQTIRCLANNAKYIDSSDLGMMIVGNILAHALLIECICQ